MLSPTLILIKNDFAYTIRIIRKISAKMDNCAHGRDHGGFPLRLSQAINVEVKFDHSSSHEENVTR